MGIKSDYEKEIKDKVSDLKKLAEELSDFKGNNYPWEINYTNNFDFETSIFNFMTITKFDFTFDGTVLAMQVIIDAIQNNLPDDIMDSYKRVAKRHNMQLKQVIGEINFTYDALSLETYERINYIFESSIFDFERKTTAEIFLKHICLKLIAEKSHGEGNRFFSYHSSKK